MENDGIIDALERDSENGGLTDTEEGWRGNHRVELELSDAADLRNKVKKGEA